MNKEFELHDSESWRDVVARIAARAMEGETQEATEKNHVT